MRAPRRLILALLAAAAIAAVASLTMAPFDQAFAAWSVRLRVPSQNLSLIQWIGTPLLAGLISGSFGAALFRTKRMVLPLSPAVGLLVALSLEWLYHPYGFRVMGLLGSTQWRALALSIPVGALLGLLVVRRLYPGGRG